MGISNFTNNSTTDTKPPIGGPTGFSLSIPDDIDPAEFLINYNDKFQTADMTLYRDEVIWQTLSVLIGKNKPNALLIGDAGVGKTKIAEDIARRLANDDPLIPDKIKGYTIYELPLPSLVAGSGIVGQLEAKIQSVIDFLSDTDNKAILFIDEIHSLIDHHGPYGRIANILKPALARGDIKTIGATTLQEAQLLLEDPAFNRRFSRIIVDELTAKQTIDILHNAKASLFKHYNNKITITDDVIEKIVFLADEYHQAGSHRPDSALTLLDRSMADAVIARKIMEENAKNNPNVLAAIQSVPLIPLTEKQVKSTAMKMATGNSKKEDLNNTAFADSLKSIKGQSDITDKILKIMKENESNLFPKNTPLTIMFAGSSGTGKTALAKLIAKAVTNTEPIILNMTEYHSPASINRIIGSPAGYIGSDSNAELPFDCLESNPYKVILLDEFEKCDKSVQTLFMSAFDEGYIKTNKGKTVDFSKTIIIATTNAAHEERTKHLGFCSNSSKQNMNSTVNELSKWFDTALLNRFDHILTFSDLSRDTYMEIVAAKYAAEVKRIKETNNKIQLLDEIPDDKLNLIADETYVAAFGARPAVRAAKDFIKEQIF